MTHRWNFEKAGTDADGEKSGIELAAGERDDDDDKVDARTKNLTPDRLNRIERETTQRGVVSLFVSRVFSRPNRPLIGKVCSHSTAGDLPWRMPDVRDQECT